MTVGAIVSVQLGSGIAKYLFPVAGPLAMAWLRVTTAAVIMTVVARPRLGGHSRRDWLVLLGYAAALVTMNVSFYQAISHIPIGLAVTIEFLGPLSVAIAKSRGVRDLVWVGLSAVGVAVLGGVPGSLNWTGVGFALIAAACWAGYILLVPLVGTRWGNAQPVAWANIFGCLTLIVPVLITHGAVFTQPGIWAAGLGLGLLGSVFPYALELAALRTLDQRVFSILMSLEPAMGALSALLILGERLSWTDLIAMGCIMAASVGITWTTGRSKPPQLPVSDRST